MEKRIEAPETKAADEEKPKFRKMKGIPFSILYDFERMKTYLITMGAEPDLIRTISAGMPGLELQETGPLNLEGSMKEVFRLNAFPLKRRASIKTPYEASKQFDQKRRAGFTKFDFLLEKIKGEL